MLVGVQGALVPKLAWPALRLLRVGIPIAAAGFTLLAAAGDLWSITVAFAVLAAGLGLAIPGFTVAPTLVVDRGQQGAVAGLVSGTVGATFIVGPLLGTALYEIAPITPVLASVAAALTALVFVRVSPTARRIGSVPATPSRPNPSSHPTPSPTGSVPGDPPLT